METSKLIVDGFGKALIALGSLVAACVLPTLVFLLIGNKVAAAMTGTFTIALVLAFTHVATFAAGAWYTKGSMRDGANIALQAQNFNDRWDTTKQANMAKLMIEGARIGKGLSGQDPMVPSLPLPSQGVDWLPDPSTLDEDAVDATAWRSR